MIKWFFNVQLIGFVINLSVSYDWKQRGHRSWYGAQSSRVFFLLYILKFSYIRYIYIIVTSPYGFSLHMGLRQWSWGAAALPGLQMAAIQQRGLDSRSCWYQYRDLEMVADFLQRSVGRRCMDAWLGWLERFQLNTVTLDYIKYSLFIHKFVILVSVQDIEDHVITPRLMIGQSHTFIQE